MASEPYTTSFYEQHRDGSRRSAEAILPLVLRLLPSRSVVDVGCGDAIWLAVSRKLGVEEVLGIDGDYVNRDILQISQEHFLVRDLTKPFKLERAFDLAISVEVAEHLPADCASGFVESLTRLAPAILFSAAIPFQGGNHHINEQWPDTWVALFREHNYVLVDLVRRRVWQNDSVYWWLAQNTLLFARVDLLERNPALKAEFEENNSGQLCLVHPKQYLHLYSLYREANVRAELPREPSGLREASRLFLGCLKNAITARLRLVRRKKAIGIE